MPRGPYAKVSAADRARIVECADGGGDWKALCANLRVNPKTAHGWVKSGAQERRPHAGGRRKALTEEQVDAICGMIEEDQGITLKALKERILADFQLNVAISTIHNYLEGRLLTLKKVHYIAADANNARNKALRVEYVQAISAHMQENKTIIWMDETNINLYCRRTQGRAPAGQRTAVALLGSKGPNVHVIGAITNFQVVKWSRLRGAFRSQSAKDWLADMLQHLPQGNNSAYVCINAALYSHLYSLGVDVNQVVLVCDNAPCHSKVQELEVDFPGLTVRRLGPYSPMLNPIENVWSKMKSHIKRHMRVPAVVRPGVGEQRLQYVETKIDEAMATITQQDCARCCQHTQGFFAAVLRNEDMAPGL